MKKEIHYFELIHAIGNAQLRQSLKDGLSAKKTWEEVTSEKDLRELTELFFAKRRDLDGCIGSLLAQDWLDFIQANRDAKIHQMGEIYK
jgi:hypothetical protein